MWMIILATVWTGGTANATTNVSVDVGVNLSAFFAVPRAEIDLHLHSGYAPEDVGRSYYIARESEIQVAEVLVLRKKGWSWGRIYGQYGIAAVDVDGAWGNARHGKGQYQRSAKAKNRAKNKEKKGHDQGNDKGSHGRGHGHK